MAINKQKYLKLFRESEGFFQNGTRRIGCLYLMFFTTYIEEGALYFYTILENVLPKVRILDKMALVQFEFGNHESLLILNSLLKGIGAEKEHESSLLKSKERLLVKFKDNT